MERKRQLFTVALILKLSLSLLISFAFGRQPGAAFRATTQYLNYKNATTPTQLLTSNDFDDSENGEEEEYEDEDSADFKGPVKDHIVLSHCDNELNN